MQCMYTDSTLYIIEHTTIYNNSKNFYKFTNNIRTTLLVIMYFFVVSHMLAYGGKVIL